METLTETPTYGSEVEHNDRVLSSQFGDGYEQRALDGLNTQRLKLRVEFDNVSREKATRVVDFLTRHGGVQAFLWTAPAPYDQRSRLWVARPPFRHGWVGYDNHTIQFIVEEVFDIAEAADPPAIVAVENEDGTFTVDMTTGTTGAVIRFTYSNTGEPAEPRVTDSVWPGETVYPGVHTDTLLSTHNSHGSEEISVYHLTGTPVPEVGDVLFCDGLELTISSVATFPPDGPDTEDARYLCGLTSDSTGIDITAPIYLRVFGEGQPGRFRARAFKAGILDSATSAATLGE